MPEIKRIKNKQKLITFTPRSIEMIEAVMIHAGYDTVTQVVRRAIEELYKSTSKYK